jgi:membrane protease YdiL (CAAX protease family)
MTTNRETKIIDGVQQHSLGRSIVLHLLPGFLILAFYIIAAKIVVRLGLPTNLALYIAVAIILIPFELGYLFHQGKKENGTFSLKNIVLFRKPIPWWQYIAFLLPCAVWIFLILVTLGPPINKFFIERIFYWIPGWFELNSGSPNDYSQSTLLLLWGFYFISNISGVFVEELYFRGYLLPRISRIGLWAPLINMVLFSLYHFFTPWENITRILAGLPCIYLVWWKKNIYLSIILHLSLNTFGMFIMLLAILGST